MRGRIGTQLGWGSAGFGVGGSRLGWIGRGRGLIGVRQDWARWIGRGWGLGSTGARLARLGLGSIGARARVDWASVHVNWSEGWIGAWLDWIGAWLDWGVVGLGAAGLGTIVADGKRRRMKVGWAGTSQVARRCIRVGVWEVHGGCALKGEGWIGTTGEHVSLDWMRRAFRALYNQNGKNSKIPIQGKSELT